MKKLLLLSVVSLTCVIYLGRLLYMQVFEDAYKLKSELNAVKKVHDYPDRGYIYDRNGKLLVSNQVAYDVMVIPREVKQLDTIALADLLKLEKKEIRERLTKARDYSWYRASVMLPQLTQEEYAPIQEKLRRFQGFYIQRRALRDYQVNHSANILGYIREASPDVVKKNPYYRLGDIIGVQGVEKQYEDLLRGVKGVKRYIRDHTGNILESYKNGAYDTLPEPGKDLYLTIDEELQDYGTKLMQGKWGGIAAIEPATGEILALVSTPTYDPKLLMGRDRSKNFTRLWYDTISRPLMDRALTAQYAPGSPFKVINALIGLEVGVVDVNEKLRCNHGYHYGGRKPLGCHPHPSPLALKDGIGQSCNAYFAQVYRRIIQKYETSHEGMDVWNKHAESFGLGNYLGTDLPIGQPGRIPDGDFYDKWYPDYPWYATTTISNSIGQGEIVATPIQLANMTAAIANRGWYKRPHILKEINREPIKDEKYTERINTTISPQHFPTVIEGMNEVYKTGTAKWARIPGIEICGKTGTAENFMNIDGVRTQLTDHSIFVAFAPMDDPQIAIAVFVENGYYGSRHAAKIAGLMIEQYLKGEITRTDMEQFVLENDLLDEYAKPYSGEPFEINQ